MLRDSAEAVDPFDGVGLFDAGEFDEAATNRRGSRGCARSGPCPGSPFAEVGGDAEVVGYEEDEGRWVGGAEVGVNGGEFFLF